MIVRNSTQPPNFKNSGSSYLLGNKTEKIVFGAKFAPFNGNFQLMEVLESSKNRELLDV
ncbi:unnamed protein product [Nesidiocoris tenuis]|uniref:Uncharacterized protein n=1 Tax=Nesidiocoris tenuis TaxID=355587 RepID=A0A6H5GU01_9HEMI|nr:unnamed protein product [Nesidiocoris tenuis]